MKVTTIEPTRFVGELKHPPTPAERKAREDFVRGLAAKHGLTLADVYRAVEQEHDPATNYGCW